ncbi:unnamed protein product [Sphacelaria rigidula]
MKGDDEQDTLSVSSADEDRKRASPAAGTGILLPSGLPGALSEEASQHSPTSHPGSATVPVGVSAGSRKTEAQAGANLTPVEEGKPREYGAFVDGDGRLVPALSYLEDRRMGDRRFPLWRTVGDPRSEEVLRSYLLTLNMNEVTKTALFIWADRLEQKGRSINFFSLVGNPGRKEGDEPFQAFTRSDHGRVFLNLAHTSKHGWPSSVLAAQMADEDRGTPTRDSLWLEKFREWVLRVEDIPPRPDT